MDITRIVHVQGVLLAIEVNSQIMEHVKNVQIPKFQSQLHVHATDVVLDHNQIQTKSIVNLVVQTRIQMEMVIVKHVQLDYIRLQKVQQSAKVVDVEVSILPVHVHYVEQVNTQLVEADVKIVLVILSLV